MYITPRPLFPGAHVAVIAPAGPLSQDPKEREDKIHACDKVLRELGLEPYFYPSCSQAYGYLAGTDEIRARDVMEAFLDPTIDGIFCIRGGYGVQRMLDKLDFEKIRKHPKWFAGYSDITALHIALNQKCQLVTYHSAMPSTELIQGVDEYTMNWLKAAMFGDLTGGLIDELPSATPVKSLWEEGKTAEGILCGGNLSLVSSSIGTPYGIDTKGKILFLEDVHEDIYRLDGMLNHMRLAGLFEDCEGIIMGYYTDCDGGKEIMPLEQVFRDLLPKDKPVLIGYSCGHARPTMTLPFGANVRLDTASCTLSVL